MLKKPKHISDKEWSKIGSQAEEAKVFHAPDTIYKSFVRAFRIFREALRAFLAFRHIYDCVTIFGSARFHEAHPYYLLARQLGKRLAEEGFTVMTGGGPGIMEAANRGAKEAGGLSIGCNIAIPVEELPNLHLDHWITFRYFFVRKVMLTRYSTAFVCLPGGLGTLDELFEMQTLIQTRRLNEFPLVLMGSEYWKPLVEFMTNVLVKHKTIDQADVDRLMITDSVEEAVAYIKNHTKLRHQVKK